MTFDQDTDWWGCLNQSSGWSDYEERCSAERSPAIRLETDDFIPWVDRAMVDCPYNGNGCTLCINDVNDAVGDLFRGQTANRPIVHNFAADPPGSSSFYNHFQGMARLADVDTGIGPQPNNTIQPVQGRVVFSRDVPPQLFVTEEHTYSNVLVPYSGAATASIHVPGGTCQRV